MNLHLLPYGHVFPCSMYLHGRSIFSPTLFGLVPVPDCSSTDATSSTDAIITKHTGNTTAKMIKNIPEHLDKDNIDQHIYLIETRKEICTKNKDTFNLYLNTQGYLEYQIHFAGRFFSHPFYSCVFDDVACILY